ncbi:MAG: O-antigen ligase family protein [Candidatus Polarisedimenticolia bacterium]
MPGVIIEAGISFLLIFTPFAFGGVEGWALGVLQIVAGIVTATWALDRFRQRGSTPMRRARAGLGIWVPIGVFVVLVVVQLIPLPPAWIARISPATHALYAGTLPGYAEGKDFRGEDLVPWLIADQADALPPVPEDAKPLPPAMEAGEPPFPIPPGVRRPLSIYPHETRLNLTLFLCYVGVFAAVLAHYNTRERIARLMVVGTFSALAVSVFGIVQKLTWTGKLYWVRETSHLNIFGPFVERNTYAAFAAVWVAVAAGMALASLRRLREGRSEELPRLLLWGAAAVGISVGIFFSLSRGGILSTGFAMLILAGLLLYYGRSVGEVGLLAAVLAVSAVFLMWLGPEALIERVGTLAEGHGVPSLQHRIEEWKRSIPMIEQNALIGTGLGTFQFAFMRHAPPGELWSTHLDNEYLELVCDMGIPGAILLIWGAGAWLLRVARPAALKGQPERHLYIGAAAGMAGLFLHSVTNANLQIPANGVLVPILAAALLNLVALASRGSRRSVEPS